MRRGIDFWYLFFSKLNEMVFGLLFGSHCYNIICKIQNEVENNLRVVSLN